MQDNNQDSTSGLSAEQSVEDANAPRNKSRRQFALAGSAVLLTVASRPVLANTAVCKSPSGFLSGNLSQHGTVKYSNGLTPGYWKNHYGYGDWPSPYVCGTLKDSKYCNSTDSWIDGESTTTKCKDQFHTTSKCLKYATYTKDGHTYAYSLMQVMWMGGTTDTYEFGAHMCAALLNAQKGLTSCLTVQNVKDMWNECDQKGYYEPTAGVKWYPDQCVTYLKSTMS